MEMKFILACVFLMVGATIAAPTPEPTDYPWQKPVACKHCPGGSGGETTQWERANEYYVIAAMANKIKSNLTDVINSDYLGRGLISGEIKTELDNYPYPALAEFPTLPSLPITDASESLERAYTDVQTVASFIELVQLEHELQAEIDTTSFNMSVIVNQSLQTTGMNKLSMEMCCTLTSHGITHPDDLTMAVTENYAYPVPPQTHSYPDRYKRDYVILRDSVTVMEYLHAEFMRHYNDALL